MCMGKADTHGHPITDNVPEMEIYQTINYEV